jgi:hypothetical protein
MSRKEDIMTIADLVNLAKDKPKATSCIYSLAEDLQINDSLNISDEQEQRFTEIMPRYWYCTDTYVGLTFYYLDNVFVGYSFQQGRKYDKEYSWVSRDSYDKVYAFVLSLADRQEIELAIIDFTEEVPDNGYSVSFYGQLLPRLQKYLYKGQKVIGIADGDSKNYISKSASVELVDGTSLVVDVKDLLVTYF